MDTGTVAFWFLAAVSLILWLSVLTKLKWWLLTIGWWFLLLASVLCFVTMFIFFLQMKWVPEWMVTQSRAIIYGVVGCTLILLIIDIWRKNRHHWAWSNDDAAE